MLYKNLRNFSDRNGLSLKYGDQVLAKVWLSFKYSECTVVGFTKNYVVLIPNGSSVSCMRAPNNVVKVKNLKNWKLNI